MSCYRATLMVLLALCTGCLGCSIFFPLFRRDTSSSSDAVSRATFYYWYTEDASQSASGVWSMQRFYTRDSACPQVRLYFVLGAWLSTLACAAGVVATLVSAVSVFAGYSVRFGVLSFLLTVLAFGASAATLVLVTLTYCMSDCGDAADIVARSPTRGDFAAVEGFGLLCGGTGGFLLLVLVEAAGFCCGCQLGGGPREAVRRPPARRHPHAPADYESQAAGEAPAVADRDGRASVDTQKKVLVEDTASTAALGDEHAPYAKKYEF